MNCIWLEPTTKLDGAGGDMAMEDKVGGGTCTATVAAVTVKLATALVTPDKEAVILAVPAAIPLARPDELMVATAGVSLDHVT